MNEDNLRQQKSNFTELENLKGKLEQQQAAKLKAEQIVSTLSRIKAREKASRKRVTTHDEGTLNSSSSERKHSSSNSSAVKEKSNLFKRKLEEDRARLESCKGSDNLNKVTEVVENIKAQLDDRDKVMQQLFLSAQQQHEYISAADSTRNEDSLTDPDIPDDVKQKIADVEAKVMDLQENLKEKDNVISARTQAITLLSEDLSRKSKTTLDTLEETQHQMRQMQNNFITIEEKMKQGNKRLKEEADDRKQKCIQAEKNLRVVEAARFDLSTRVAELQEKVVTLQAKNIEMEKNIVASEVKHNDLTNALETSKQASAKIKAKFQLKMKVLQEEHDSLKKMSGDGAAISSLQEKIAELEEEKEQCSLLKGRISDLEQKLSQQGEDLDDHVKLISKLEAEKLDLIQVIQERNILVVDKDSLIITTKCNIRL